MHDPHTPVFTSHLFVAVLRAGFAASLSPVAIFALAASSCFGVAALTVRRARLGNEEEGGPDDRCQMKSHLKFTVRKNQEFGPGVGMPGVVSRHGAAGASYLPRFLSSFVHRNLPGRSQPHGELLLS